MATLSYTVAGTSGQDHCWGQWIGVLSSTHTWNSTNAPYKWSIRCAESATTANAFMYVSVSIMSGTTFRAQEHLTDALEMNTSLQSRFFSAATPTLFNGYTNVVGDFLVIGIGFDKTSTTSTTMTCRVGTTGATDLAENDTTVADDVPWIEFTNLNITITEAASGPNNQLMMTGCGI
jgi:hypothetical protein